MENVRPIIMQNPKTGVCNKLWEFKVLIFEKGIYLGEISSEEAPELKYKFYTYYLNDIYPVIGNRSTLYTADSQSTPNLWKWFDNNETTWIPFKLTFTKLDSKALIPVQPKKEYEITQWVKLGPKDAMILTSKENEFNSIWKSRRSTYELRTDDGQIHRIPLLDGLPELEDQELLTVHSIQPIIGSLGKNGTRTAAWLAMIHWKDKIKNVTIEISDIQGNYKSRIKLGKDTLGKIYFGIKDEFPDFWTWENISGDSWLPFRFHLASETGEVVDFIQWIKISAKAKREWKKLN
jgi:hypothetical protein